ncbi:MAG: zf-HC2 domain-containing protein [Solirubrobacteraceae bacterium]
MEPEKRIAGHLENDEVAAYLDRALPLSDRRRVEEHLADCDVCSAEVVEVARLLQTRPRRQSWYLPLGVTAAAAALLLLYWPRAAEGPAASNYREATVNTTVAPVVIAPRGATIGAPKFAWIGVPHADRYRLMVFDGTGRVVWEGQTSDTIAVFPETIALQQETPYFWKVEAQTGWKRWVGSDLVEFNVGPPRP